MLANFSSESFKLTAVLLGRWQNHRNILVTVCTRTSDTSSHRGRTSRIRVVALRLALRRSQPGIIMASHDGVTGIRIFFAASAL